MKAIMDISEWNKGFSQDGDCCNGERQHIDVQQLDGGGGPFWVITTERWAFDNIEEFVALLRHAGVEEKAKEKTE